MIVPIIVEHFSRNVLGEPDPRIAKGHSISGFGTPSAIMSLIILIPRVEIDAISSGKEGHSSTVSKRQASRYNDLVCCTAWGICASSSHSSLMSSSLLASILVSSCSLTRSAGDNGQQLISHDNLKTRSQSFVPMQPIQGQESTIDRPDCFAAQVRTLRGLSRWWYGRPMSASQRALTAVRKM